MTVEYVEYNVSKEKKLIVVNGLCADGKKNCETQKGISGGRYYAKVGALVAVNGNPEILSKLILEQTADERQTLTTGEPWDLGGEYSLVARQIDLEDNKVWLELQRKGEELDNAVVEAGRVYNRVVEHIEGETNVPMFVTYVDAIVPGTKTNMVRLCHTWLISDDVETIEQIYACRNREMTSTAGSYTRLSIHRARERIIRPPSNYQACPLQ